MVLLEFSMFPLQSGSLSPYVARSLDIIDKSGLKYQLNPMGTVIEGEWDQVMTVVHDCFDAMSADCDRISTTIKIDYRKGSENRITAKVSSVEEAVGRDLST